uniref:Receptor expression-enhancing protein n=1 Tax=Panagrolaimus sp. ES5 TaxID=591445 RepID=A0AC34G5M8_9BILA
MSGEKVDNSFINSAVQRMFGQKDAPIENLILNIERKTNLRRDQIAYIILGFITTYFVITSADRVLYTVITIIVPLCKTVKSLPASLEQTKWHTYWSVFAAFSVFDIIGIPLFGSFYYMVKSAALLYLYVSQPQQLSNIYQNYVQPFALTLETNIIEKFPTFKTE